MEKITYINNDPTAGIKYDWKKIMNEYRRLGVPPEYDYSAILPMNRNDIGLHLLLSERSIGKTTTLLLIGMCMYKLYGSPIQLVRHTISNASSYDKLFRTINAYNNGQYISRLTDGKYNYVKYFQRNFYFSNMRETGKIEKSNVEFCTALGADECYDVCSKYDAPQGDLIILDECFNDSNRADEFVRFYHLFKTIARERESPKVFILGNNIDVNNIWFRQLTISDQIRAMRKGECKMLQTSAGMNIYTYFLENRAPEKRKRFNKKYLGFDNPALNSITGNGNWVTKNYPLITSLGAECRELRQATDREYKKISRGVFMSFHGDLFLEIEFLSHAGRPYVFVHPSTARAAQRGMLVYTIEPEYKTNTKTYGHDRMSLFINDMCRKQQIVFSDNETGNLFDKFMGECKL